MQGEPRILAVETSGRVGSVALAVGGRLLECRQFTHGLRHAVGLMPMVAELCEKHGWRPGEIEQVYVAQGPGSFTGLRIAITVAKTLQQALGCKLVGVPTLDVVACNAPAEVENLIVLLDAKRGQVFAAKYQRTSASAEAAAKLLPNGLVCTAGPELVDPAAYVRSSPKPLHILGEGIDYHRPALQAGVDNPADLIELPKELWGGAATAVHQLGWQRAQRGEFTEAEKLLPTYIRLPEAEELWNKRHGLTT